MHNQKLKIETSIAGSYRFLANHMPHFFQLIYGPLFLWLVIKVSEQILVKKYNIQINGDNLLHLCTAVFAIVWYRQSLLGIDHATYGQLLKDGFSGQPFTLKRLGHAATRITVITLALLIPAMIISMSVMIYYKGQGINLSEKTIQMLAAKSIFIVMVIFSPIIIRLSLYTAGFALGRTSLSFKQVWNKTRGYTVTLWWITIRGFLPLSIYSYVLTWFLHNVTQKLSIHYIVSTILIESLTAFLTFMMLAIVVSANAESFRILFGVRDGDGLSKRTY